MSKVRSAAALAGAVVLVMSSAGGGSASTSISISPYVSTVFAIGPTQTICAEWNRYTDTWSEIGGPAVNLYVGEPGLFEAVSYDPTSEVYSGIYRYSGTPGDWTEIGGPGTEFAVGGSHLYGLGPTNNYVAQWNADGTGWTVIGGPSNAIFAGGFGLFATGPGIENGLYRYDGTPGQWTLIDSGANEYWVNDNDIYQINETTFQVEQWNSTSNTWSVIGPYAKWLYAGASGLYLVDGDNDIEQYTGTPGDWDVIGGPSNLVAVSQTNLFATGVNSNSRGALRGLRPVDPDRRAGRRHRRRRLTRLAARPRGRGRLGGTVLDRPPDRRTADLPSAVRRRLGPGSGVDTVFVTTSPHAAVDMRVCHARRMVAGGW